MVTSPRVKPQSNGARVIGVLGVGRVSEWPMEKRPCCVTCRQPFYVWRKKRGLYWLCRQCPVTVRQHETDYKLRPNQRDEKIAARAKYPIKFRPFCIKCKNRMNVSCGPARQKLKTHSPDMWECWRHEKKITCAIHRGGDGHEVRYRPLVALDRHGLPINTKDIPNDVKPFCVDCRERMNVGGSKAGRRWQCKTCGVSVLRVGKGNRARASEYRIPERDPAYLETLFDLSDQLAKVVRQNGGQEFNAQIVRLNRAIKFYALNSDEANRAAVAKEIDNGLATLEELADVIPLSEQHLKVICNQLVNAKGSAYEWRPIGAHTAVARGPQARGVFRRDAITYQGAEAHDPFKYSPHHEHLAAVHDLAAHIKKMEAKKGKAPLPWESKEQAARRVAGHKDERFNPRFSAAR